MGTELPRISVVTPAFNSVFTIAGTIESVRGQDYTNWEHIVVDGGSQDGTVALLARHPGLKWVSEKDEGHYHAMNKGIARATGDVVVILNADDCFRPGALRAVAEAFQKNPSWDALFGDVIFVTGEGREIYRRKEVGYDYKILLYGVDYICHQTLFVRKGVYERLGGYRHKEFFNSADYEFKLRLGRAGCRVGHVPEFLVDYRYHRHGQSADRRIIRNMIQEAVVIRREHGNPGGWRGACLRPVFKAKRQVQKLWFRHTCDFIPGTWRLKSHLRSKTQFSSNAGLDKLSSR
jgi:glycosyltransferase involved in cell wall biosynthesis